MEATRRRHAVLGPVLVVLTITLTGLGLLGWCAVAAARGSSSSPWLTALWVAILPALAIAGSAYLVFTAYLSSPPRFAAVLAVTYVVLVVLGGIAVSVAAASYEDDPTVALALLRGP